MFIGEAIKQALEQGKKIKRTVEFWKYTTVEPTIPNDCCSIHVKWPATRPEKPVSAPRWQPNAVDLMAEDWIVVDD